MSTLVETSANRAASSWKGATVSISREHAEGFRKFQSRSTEIAC